MPMRVPVGGPTRSGLQRSSRTAAAIDMIWPKSTPPSETKRKRSDVQPMSPKVLEARAWLRANQNLSALATNRFYPTERAMAYVNALYDAGAVEVHVDNICLDAIDRDRGPYYCG